MTRPTILGGAVLTFKGTRAFAIAVQGDDG